jgi:hypothetical protein
LWTPELRAHVASAKATEEPNAADVMMAMLSPSPHLEFPPSILPK